MNKDRSKYSVT